MASCGPDVISAPIPHAQTQRRTLACSSRPHQIHMQTCAQSGEQRLDLVPSLGSGSELLPMVQNNIVNHPFSLAGSRLTICCLPLECGTPGVVPLDPSTIRADRLLQRHVSGPVAATTNRARFGHRFVLLQNPCYRTLVVFRHALVLTT